MDAWEFNRELVETSIGTIIVNAHRETIPIPEGYTKEGWIDKRRT